MASVSAAQATWESAGCGHLDPAMERQELRLEIDEKMSAVEKLVRNKDLSAEDRIDQIEGLKTEIWERKIRISEIKRDQRGEKPEGPSLPKLPVAEPSTAPLPAVEHTDRKPSVKKKKIPTPVVTYPVKPGFRVG